MNLEDLKKYDSSGMYKIYDEWPKIAKKSYESNFKRISYDGINHIVFAGMGGSGTIGDLFSSVLSPFLILWLFIDPSGGVVNHIACYFNRNDVITSLI